MGVVKVVVEDDQDDHEVAQAVPIKKAKTKAKAVKDLGSIQDGKDLFAWMISPLDPDEFFETTFEKRPLHIKRSGINSQYYKHLFSTKVFDEILREKVSYFIPIKKLL